MTKEQYATITEPFRSHPGRTSALQWTNRMLAAIVFASYALLLLGDLFTRNRSLAIHMIVPLDAFLIVSAARFLINRPRPYERFEMQPVVAKRTKGKSFPSRHVFSAFMIAMTFLLATDLLWVGVSLLVLCVLIGVIRVISGVHYISDVIAGAVCGIVAGIVGFWLL